MELEGQWRPIATYASGLCVAALGVGVGQSAGQQAIELKVRLN